MSSAEPTGEAGAPAAEPAEVKRPARDTLVVDAQIHIWRDEDEQHPWLPEWRSYAHRGGTSPTAEELIAAMDQAGVDRAVLVPPSFAGDSNEVALEAAARYPERFAVMGRVPLAGGHRPDIASWASTPGMLGVRLTFSRGASYQWLTDGTADWFWREAQAASVPVMVFTPERVGALVPVLRRYPGLRLIVDHAGLPAYPPPMPMESIVGQAVALAAFPNVAVKASAFPCATTEPFPFPTAQRCTRTLVEAFGPERVFWGTDLTRLPCSYTEAVRYLAEDGGLTPAQLSLVMGRGILDWLGWDAG